MPKLALLKVRVFFGRIVDGIEKPKFFGNLSDKPHLIAHIISALAWFFSYAFLL